MRPWPLLLLPALTLAVAAQSSSSKPATGSVTGHVYCADTNAPARMARVQLESMNNVGRWIAGNLRLPSVMPVGGSVQTALDGSFVIPNVPAGSYYVVARIPGYLSPRANAEDADEALPPAPAGEAPVVVPKVDVQADQTAAVDIRLVRGAAVSGTIRFDDGSPAIGMHVGLVCKAHDKQKRSNPDDVGIPGNETTDDLGRYRISGVRDGEYIIEALLTHMDLVLASTGSAASNRSGSSRGERLSGVMVSALIIYSGDATRKSDAVSFKLDPGEERAGEDITISLSKLHTVSGVVTAARDGYSINSGNLTIITPADKEIVVDAEINNDGTFHIESVPEGTYILRIHRASDKQIGSFGGPDNINFSDEKTIHQYRDLEQPIKVEGDIPNLVLAVPEAKSQAASTASQ